MTIEEGREDGNFLYLKFREIADRTAAEKIIGGYLEVTKRSKLRGKWIFYIDDLIGLAVVTLDGRPCGTIASVEELPQSHVIEVASPQGELAMIPFLETIRQGSRISRLES